MILTLHVQLGAQERTAPGGPPLQELVLDGASVYSVEDVFWLLHIRQGTRLPGTPEETAEELEARYKREGYTAARVVANYDQASGRLTLTVDEGRLDAVEFEGVASSLATRLRDTFTVRPGDVYNVRIAQRAIDELLGPSEGALTVASPGLELVERDGRRILVVPIDAHGGVLNFSTSSEAREDFFSPVDGFAPAFSLEAIRFDTTRFNHTIVVGRLGYKFSRDEWGYSLGVEQPVLAGPRIAIGAEVHDLTASDDLWRLSTTEQSVVSIAFKNTFRDYYRRKGVQAFAAIGPAAGHEIVASMRWDRHEALGNTTDYSFFRDDHDFRENAAIGGGEIRSLVLAYSFDSRPRTDTAGGAYGRHLVDDLFRNERRSGFGGRVDWTTEVAGHGLGGEYEFDRHILNARAYLPLGPRQSLSGRLILGFSGGALPIERRFSIGGIGTVHGYRFKESTGEELTLVNLEYALDVLPIARRDQSLLRGLVFYDAGRVRNPVAGSRADWLRGAGVGVQTGPIRVEFGFRLDDIPRSRQILVRISPTF